MSQILVSVPDSIAFVFSQESLDALRRFYYIETGIASEARVWVEALLLLANEKGIALEDVLMSFRKHNTVWCGQDEESRGNPFDSASSKNNREVFRTVCGELGLVTPAELSV